jgi:mannose-6-phosphate isomerase-like protein (cupin superfamily)
MAYVVNIEEETLRNKNYRKVLYTSSNLYGIQLVVMSIKRDEEIGMEKHSGVDQFIRVEEGEATVIIGKVKKEYHTLHPTDAVVIPAGTWHNVINTGSKMLKLYSIYTPPEHKDGTVQKTKPKMD